MKNLCVLLDLETPNRAADSKHCNRLQTELQTRNKAAASKQSCRLETKLQTSNTAVDTKHWCRPQTLLQTCILQTLPQTSNTATYTKHCHRPRTLPQTSNTATYTTHCHTPQTLPHTTNQRPVEAGFKTARISCKPTTGIRRCHCTLINIMDVLWEARPTAVLISALTLYCPKRLVSLLLHHAIPIG